MAAVVLDDWRAVVHDPTGFRRHDSLDLHHHDHDDHHGRLHRIVFVELQFRVENLDQHRRHLLHRVRLLLSGLLPDLHRYADHDHIVFPRRDRARLAASVQHDDDDDRAARLHRLLHLEELPGVGLGQHDALRVPAVVSVCDTERGTVWRLYDHGEHRLLLGGPAAAAALHGELPVGVRHGCWLDSEELRLHGWRGIVLLRGPDDDASLRHRGIHALHREPGDRHHDDPSTCILHWTMLLVLGWWCVDV